IKSVSSTNESLTTVEILIALLGLNTRVQEGNSGVNGAKQLENPSSWGGHMMGWPGVAHTSPSSPTGTQTGGGPSWARARPATAHSAVMPTVSKRARTTRRVFMVMLPIHRHC